MTKMINYGDTLFLIREIIGTLKDALQLEADAALFAGKLTQDIFFVQTALDKLYDSLQQGRLLIDRHEYLNNLMHDENLLAGVLDDITTGRTRLTEEFKPLHEKFQAMADACRERAAAIQVAADNLEPAVGENGDMISPAEYEFLLVDTETSSAGGGGDPELV